jgi:hypothetical protein
MADPQNRYQVVFEAVPGLAVPGEVALRRVLKYSLRVAGLRCVEIRELSDPPVRRGCRPSADPPAG